MTATPEASGGLEAALEELFGTDPAEFTKTRDALAKRLKGSGDEAAAAEVRGRRKPTQIAWVLNQLARRHPDEVAELVDVGRELLREQRKALRGDATTSLRESIERQRKVVADLTRTASKVIADLGVPATGLEEVASSLRAALVDPVVGARLEEGRFEKAPEPTAGFAGPMPDVPVEAPKAAPERPAPKKRETAAEKKAQAKRIAEQHVAAAKAAKADESAKKKAIAKERSDRLAEERARKKAVAKALAALHAAEAAAKKQEAAATKARAEAEKIRKEAERADARATKLEAAASESATRADEARKAVEELGG